MPRPPSSQKREPVERLRIQQQRAEEGGSEHHVAAVKRRSACASPGVTVGQGPARRRPVMVDIAFGSRRVVIVVIACAPFREKPRPGAGGGFPWG